jgi:acylaminoacyl-peptidase
MKRPLVKEDLLRINFVSCPDISSCGTKVAYVRSHIDEKTKDYRSNVFLSELSPGTEHQLTFGTKHDNSPRFSPDGTLLAFVSDRSGEKQIWILDLQRGGEARQLTSMRYGATGPVWSPHGNKIAFASRFAPDEKREELFTVRSSKEKEEEEKKRREQPKVVDRLRYKSDEAMGFVDGKRSHIWVVDAEGGDPLCLTDGDYDHTSPAWSPDGLTIAFAGNRDRDTDINPSYSDIYTVPANGGDIRRVTATQGPAASPKWSPDGQFIAYIGHHAEYLGATLSRVWLVEARGGAPRCLTMELDRSVGDQTGTDSRYGAAGEFLIFATGGDFVYFLASDRGSTHIYTADLSGRVTQITHGDRHVQGLGSLQADGKLVFASGSFLNPANVCVLQEEEETQLTDHNRALLDEVFLSEPEELWYKGVDGWDVQGWLMRPINFEEGKRYPLILEIHGGPHTQYGCTFFHEFQMLASKGYGVLFTNPRGSHGYGQTFVDAVRGDYGGNDYGDLMMAMDHVEQLSWVDKDRLGVTGGSYGGFMTNWIVAKTDRFKGAVTQRSITNWISFYGVSDIGYYFTEHEVGGNPLDDVEMLLKHSPLSYVKNIKTPLLVIHSEQDMRCPIEQGEQLFICLKKLGVKTRLVRFPGSNHELSRSGKPVLRLERLQHIADWFADTL